jgi:hypothetical protein
LEDQLGDATEPGEVISSSLAKSAVNQVISKRMVKKQQMRWSPAVPTCPPDPHPGGQ